MAAKSMAAAFVAQEGAKVEKGPAKDWTILGVAVEKGEIYALASASVEGVAFDFNSDNGKGARKAAAPLFEKYFKVSTSGFSGGLVAFLVGKLTAKAAPKPKAATPDVVMSEDAVQL